MAEYKDNLFKRLNNTKLMIGDKGYVDKKHFVSYKTNGQHLCQIVSFLEDKKLEVKIAESDYEYIDNAIINRHDFKRCTVDIGYNPFEKNVYSTKLVKYDLTLSGILNLCGYTRGGKWDNLEEVNGVKVQEVNFSPYVVNNNGKCIYFQRDFIWGLEDKQKLIDSIYKGLYCGCIILRKRDYDFIEKCALKKEVESIGFYDVIDGKQRLNALLEFVNDVFPDKDGFYFSDLSERALRTFYNSKCFSYLELSSKATDKDTFDCFLSVNGAGVSITKDYLVTIKDMYCHD